MVLFEYQAVNGTAPSSVETVNNNTNNIMGHLTDAFIKAAYSRLD